MRAQETIPWHVVDAALQRYAIRDDRQISGEIRPIVRANWRSGRLENFQHSYGLVSIDHYIDHVAETYLTWQPNVTALLYERDPQRWEECYQQLTGWAIGFLIGKVGAYAGWMEEVALGYVHETVEALLGGSAQYTYQSPFDKWLHRVLRNCCCKGARRVASSQSRFERNMLPLADWNCEQSSDPHAVTSEERFILQYELPEAIASLPAADQTIVKLHYYQEIPLKQVADALECSPQAVYNRHDRLKKKLFQFF